MANKRITDLPAKALPLTGGEVGVIDDGVNTYKHDLRYWGAANATFTYNSDDTIATITKAGKTMTFNWSDGVLQSCTDGTITKTFSYTDGLITSVVIT
jgi:hypothetical protein